MVKNRRRTRKKQIKQSRRQVIRIDVLPDDVLLDIFDFYVGLFSSFTDKRNVEAWQLLVRVCRRWRTLVLTSPLRLNLQLYLTPNTPARDMDIWPALPLIVSGRVSQLPDTNNIISALRRSNRICQVALFGLAARQLEQVSAAMQVPFPELIHLRLSISSPDETPPVIPDSFLGGSAPRLQFVTLNGIPFPSLPNLLLSANHLVDLHLRGIPHSGYIPPKAMVTLLSVLSNLKVLTMEYRSPQSRPDSDSRSSPPPKRFTLPALNEFDFKGVTEYLEEFVTHIDTPQLHRVGITFFNQIDFDTPRLAQFINRTPVLRASNKAHVMFNESATIVNLEYPTSKSGLDDLWIAISCREPDWQVSSIEQVCNSALPPLPMVEDLRIEHQYTELVWKNDAIENILWLQLLLPFTAVKNLHLSKELAPGIAVALQELVGVRIAEVLPGLQNIYVEGLEPSGPLRDNFGQFVTARQLSGHPVAILTDSTPFIPPASPDPGVYIHPALAVPSLLFDMRSHPTKSNPRISPAIRSAPASSPPLGSLALCVGNLPWLCTVSPDGGDSRSNAFVTVQDVLVAIYFHLRTAVTGAEYEAMSKSRRAEIFRAFESRVGRDETQRTKGLRRVDFLGGRFRAQGLVRAQSNDSVWDVVTH